MNTSVKKILTVAIPAYNAEKYLSKCIESLCHKSFLNELDIIVVNDGSKDDTSVIAHAYEERFPESVTVIDKENGGHGSGINTAIARARGKYFRVLDADDWVESSNMPEFLSYLKDSSADIVLCNFHMVDMLTGNKQPFRTERIPLGKEYTFSEFMEYPRSSRQCCFFHGITYRTEFYRKTGIQLTEKIFYEDQEYATLPAYFARTILPLDLFIYQYMVGNINQSISNENQVRNLWQIEKVFWNICDFYCNHRDMSEDKREYFLFKLSSLLLSYYVAGFLKDKDRAHGRATARSMSHKVREQCPELYVYSRKKYLIAYLLHLFYISSDVLEKAKRTKLYYAVRKFI